MTQTGQIREELQEVFMSGKTKDVEYRRQQIMKLGYMIQVCLYS